MGNLSSFPEPNRCTCRFPWIVVPLSTPVGLRPLGCDGELSEEPRPHRRR